MYLKSPLLEVFSDTLILAGPSVKAVANVQDGGEQGAGEPVTDSDGQLDWLCGEGHPGQEAVPWSNKHKGIAYRNAFITETYTACI